jgi:hypothetical protein
MKKNTIKSLTKSPPQVEIVTLAVFLLGGDQRSIDTEDIAVEAHRLAPGRFAWRKYPDQVNLELVRVYLSDAKKPSKGAWLEGSGKDGWSLTPAGLTWAKDHAGKIRGRDLRRERQDIRSGSVDERRWRRERTRITSSEAWARWRQGAGEISPREVADVFRIDSYADQRLRNLKVGRIRSMFEEDDELAPFLKRMADLIEPRKEK